MITVVIPALNEEKTIDAVVKFCRQHSHVSEIIVVDDNSEDNTATEAENAGAKVLVSYKRGKGISMKEGIAAATNEIIVFLDADIENYPKATIPLLTQPLLNGGYDFVKSTFLRNAGRVTEIMAKPLLSIFYPDLLSFSQPLSGMIAGRKSFFNKIDFFNDYGVDIGILIDMYLMQARMKEVNIGYIENKSKAWTALGKMSMEVARAITMKALQHRKDLVNTYTSETFHAIANSIGSLIHREHRKAKLIVFDMNSAILSNNFLDSCAMEYGFKERLDKLRSEENDAVAFIKRAALLLKGLPVSHLLTIAGNIIIDGAITEAIKNIKQQGYVVGILTSDYQVIANYIKNRVEADFAIGNQLEHYEGKVTGEVQIPSCFYPTAESRCNHSVCNTNVLLYACNEYKIDFSQCTMVGDIRENNCLLELVQDGPASYTKEGFLFSSAGKLQFPLLNNDRLNLT